MVMVTTPPDSVTVTPSPTKLMVPAEVVITVPSSCTLTDGAACTRTGGPQASGADPVWRAGLTSAAAPNLVSGATHVGDELSTAHPVGSESIRPVSST